MINNTVTCPFCHSKDIKEDGTRREFRGHYQDDYITVPKYKCNECKMEFS